MNKLAAQEGQDQKLMELYFTIYQKNELGNVLEEIRAFDALEVYFLAERATGRHPHLDDSVHRVLRDCASARVRIDEITHERNAATAALVSYAGIVFFPPLVMLLIDTAFIWMSSQSKTN